MTGSDSPKRYDVALSFAGEDRDYVEAVATALMNKGLRVFYDRFEEADLVGRNLVDHLSDVYQSRARLCVVFVSRAYAQKPFPRLERQAAQATALLAEQPYIIPVRLDDTEVPGLLSTVAYVSGKTPEGLAHLVASKLMLSEAPGPLFSTIPGLRQAVLVRFNSLVEPDMNTFRQTVQRFEHWSEAKLWSVPVELRLPQPIQTQIEDARTFRHTDSWKSPRIGEEARQQHLKFYDERLPAFLSNTAEGVQTLIHHYGFGRRGRLELVVRRYLMSRMTTLCRLLLDFRLIGMGTPQWEPLFAHFSHVWSEWVMYGLPYACFLDGDERFLWIDADGRDTSTTISWPHDRFRLYVPSELLVSRTYDEVITSDQFDRFFAVQLLEAELKSTPGQPLLYFMQYPDRLRLTIRGEWAVDSEHFSHHGTSNFGGEPLYGSIRKLREDVIRDADRKGQKDHERYMAVDRIRQLFRERNQFDSILWPSDA
jgi:TIR domain